MTSSTFFFFFIPILAFILLGINFIFAPHNPYLEKNGAFECGFTSFLGQNRTQFSISFFIFALLFLLFDLEILLVYPYLVSSYSNESYGLVILLIFLAALTLGFVFELGKKALSIDSRQTIKIKNTTVNLNIAMIISSQDIISSFMSLYEASNISNIISWYNISNTASHIINYLSEEITSYLLIIVTDYYTALLNVVLSFIIEQCYLMTILMNYLMPLKRVLSYILKRGYLVAGGVQLFITCTCLLLYSVLFHCSHLYINLIVMSYTIAGISLFIGYNKNLKTKYPTLYKYIEIFLIISIIILTFYLGFSIYLVTLYAKNSSRTTRSKTTANKGGGPSPPDGPNKPKPPYETTAACGKDEDNKTKKNNLSTNKRAVQAREWYEKNPQKLREKRDKDLARNLKKRLDNSEAHRVGLDKIKKDYYSMTEQYEREEPENYEMYENDRLKNKRDARNNRINKEGYDVDKAKERRRENDKRRYDKLKTEPDKLRELRKRDKMLQKLKRTDPDRHAQLIRERKLEKRLELRNKWK